MKAKITITLTFRDQTHSFTLNSELYVPKGASQEIMLQAFLSQAKFDFYQEVREEFDVKLIKPAELIDG